MIDSAQQGMVAVASSDANAEIDSDVPVQAVIISDRRVVIDSDVVVSSVVTMRDSE